jgi:hypothetical protein
MTITPATAPIVAPTAVIVVEYASFVPESDDVEDEVPETPESGSSFEVGAGVVVVVVVVLVVVEVVVELVVEVVVDDVVVEVVELVVEVVLLVVEVVLLVVDVVDDVVVDVGTLQFNEPSGL